MGVHGLWRLLDSFGTVVQPDDLKGKRVAIDASIWIAQFRARIAPGEDVEHMIVEGFLARILKLLFYGIKPVFVFDGQASSSKGAEHQRRMRQRAINEQAQLKRRAKQILMAQVAAGSINLEELRSAIAADTEASSGATAVQKNAGGNGAAGVETGSTNGSDAAAAGRQNVGENSQLKGATATRLLHRTRHHGKRRRDKEKTAGPDADHTPSHHHSSNNQHRHGRRRTRRLAPDAVSARSTVHFLQDVEGLIEDRAKQEARVLHNALQHTSTSLFMGPRRAVEDDGAAETETKAGTPSPPPSAVVIEDSVSRHNSHDEVISVTDSGEEEEEKEGEDASSSCCAVSSSTVSVAAEEDDDAAVQVQQRQRTSSQSPPNTNGATILHSNDLTRFLASLSQRMPAAATAAHTVAAAAAVAPQAHGLEDVKETEHDRSSGDSSGSTEHSAASHTMATAAVTVDTEDEIDNGDEEEESGTSSCVESEASSDDEEALEEEDSDTDSGSDTWSDDEEEEGEEEDVGDPSDTAADLTWEPFTQRLTSLLPQSIAAVLQQDESPPSQGTPEPQDRHASDKADDDDDDYTPVKLGQPFSARPPTAMAAAATSAAATVVVSSSEEDERSNSSVLVAASSPAIATAYGASAPASEAVGDTRSIPLQVSGPPAVPRPAAARRSVAIIPFELLHIVELLECCGLPYVLSPAEADAQCAFLARHGLVDAVFTEDSDVLVHGATTVLRGFFSQSKSVVAYRQAELAACGITKTVLVALASLLGCDYTEGVQGIGLVGALEALVVAWTALENRDNSTESPLAARHVLRRWRDLVQRPPLTWHDVDDDMTVAQFALLRSAITQWHLLEQRPTFPERQPIEAFYSADVDDDVTPFTWLPPNWQQIRIFAGGLGALSSTWLVQRFELARKECLKREGEEAAAQERGQRRLTEFGARERVRAEWAFQKQPRRHAAVLSQLRAVQLLA